MGKDSSRLFRATRLAVAAFAAAVIALAASPARLGAQQQLPYQAVPAPQGVTGGEPSPIDGSQGQALEGQGAALSPPDNARDSDRDGYYDYAEKHFNTNPFDAAKHPLDRSPDQANRDQDAIRSYYAENPGKGLKAGKTAASAEQSGTIVSRHPYLATAAGVGILGIAGAVAIGAGGGSDADGQAPGVRSFAGTISGQMVGTAPTPGGGTVQVSNVFTLVIAADGGATFSAPGWGTGTGTVTANGAVSGTGFSGTISRSGNTLSGSGGWTGPYGSGGSWSGTGPAAY